MKLVLNHSQVYGLTQAIERGLPDLIRAGIGEVNEDQLGDEIRSSKLRDTEKLLEYLKRTDLKPIFTRTDGAVSYPSETIRHKIGFRTTHRMKVARDALRDAGEIEVPETNKGKIFIYYKRSSTSG